MHLYHLLSKLFPGSFSAKIVLMAFVGVHVPLLAIMAYLGLDLQRLWSNLDIVAVILVATVVGTAATIYAMRVLFSPLRLIEQTLSDLVDRRKTTVLPEIYGDEVGQLMRHVNRMIRGIERRIEIATRTSETDPLTGILNRRGFERLVPDGCTGAILYVDVDHFKRLNDTYGHATGDRVLRELARMMALSIRDEDVLTRFGGEEFVLFLDKADPATAVAVAERLRTEAAGAIVVDGSGITVSIGVACAQSETGRDVLIERADHALYRAKDEGRNRTVLDAHSPRERTAQAA